MSTDRPTKAEREAAAKPGCTCVLCAMYHSEQAPSAEDVVIASLQREVADLKDLLARAREAHSNVQATSRLITDNALELQREVADLKAVLADREEMLKITAGALAAESKTAVELAHDLIAAAERRDVLGDVLCAIGFDLARGPTKMVDDGLDFGGMVNLQLVIFGDGLAKRQRALEHVTAIMSGLAEVMVVEELVDESVPRLQRRAARRAGQGGGA